MAKPTTANRLEAARAELAATNRQIAELDTARNKALLADDDRTAVKLAGQIDDLRRLAHGHQDKIGLLEAEAEREANERRVKEKLGLIGRIERKLGERTAAVAELADAVKQADTLFRRVCSLSRDIDAAWPWQSHDRVAIGLPAGSILEALRHEVFRVGNRPRLFGNQAEDADAGIDYPGGAPPRIEMRGVPHQVTPIVDVFRQAAECASGILRTGRSTSGAMTAPPDAGVPVALRKDPPALTPAQRHLAELHRRMAELATDPSREAEYNLVVGQVADAASAVEAERIGEPA